MKLFKIGAVGWHMGCKFKITDREQFDDGSMVYQLRFQDVSKLTGRTLRWTEYMSHQQLVKDKVFYFADNGDYVGRHNVALALGRSDLN